MINFSSLKNTKMLFFVLSMCIWNAEAQEVNIIPYPNQVEMQNGVFNLSASTRIYYDKEFKNEAVFLQQLLLNEHQLKLAVSEQSSDFIRGNIYLKLSDAEPANPEGYTLKVDENNILATSGFPTGVFYAIQSLRQIIKNQGKNKVTVQCLTINDTPRLAWRAFMLDEARYFKGAKVVKNLLDEMALLKMNTFHWHLTDDPGWRIEIKKYPLLTQVGGTRKESEIGTWLSNKFDGKVHSGFYTQEQIKDIIKYAADRHITIIPEIEMPGHASAAMAAYPWLGTENKKITVPTVFRIQLNVFNVTSDRVNKFLRDVLDEVMELFPSKIVHIGGDEVKYDQWKNSPEVNEYMKKNNISSYADLQISFTNAISNYLEQKQHRMMGWNEIISGQHENNDSTDAMTQKLSSNVIVHFWTGSPKIINQAAEKGYDLVNSYSEYTYLDYDYKTTSLQKAYSFNPVPDSIPEHLRDKILGLGCQMWGEWIPTVAKMNYQIFPRIAAHAETGWTQTARKDFARFTGALSYLKNHWSRKGYYTN